MLIIYDQGFGLIPELRLMLRLPDAALQGVWVMVNHALSANHFSLVVVCVTFATFLWPNESYGVLSLWNEEVLFYDGS